MALTGALQQLYAQAASIAYRCANGERRDANGNLVFSRCTTIKGTRIKIEPLPDQCQSIPLPQ